MPSPTEQHYRDKPYLQDDTGNTTYERLRRLFASLMNVSLPLQSEHYTPGPSVMFHRYQIYFCSSCSPGHVAKHAVTHFKAHCGKCLRRRCFCQQLQWNFSCTCIAWALHRFCVNYSRWGMTIFTLPSTMHISSHSQDCVLAAVRLFKPFRGELHDEMIHSERNHPWW